MTQEKLKADLRTLEIERSALLATVAKLHKLVPKEAMHHLNLSLPALPQLPHPTPSSPGAKPAVDQWTLKNADAKLPTASTARSEILSSDSGLKSSLDQDDVFVDSNTATNTTNSNNGASSILSDKPGKNIIVSSTSSSNPQQVLNAHSAHRAVSSSTDTRIQSASTGISEQAFSRPIQEKQKQTEPGGQFKQQLSASKSSPVSFQSPISKTPASIFNPMADSLNYDELPTKRALFPNHAKEGPSKPGPVHRQAADSSKSWWQSAVVAPSVELVLADGFWLSVSAACCEDISANAGETYREDISFLQIYLNLSKLILIQLDGISYIQLYVNDCFLTYYVDRTAIH